MKYQNRFTEGKTSPYGIFKLEFLTWQECEYLGKLAREGKIKVSGTGKRSLKIVPLGNHL